MPAFKLFFQKNGAGGYQPVPVGSASAPTISWGVVGTISYSSSGGSTVNATYPNGITADSALVIVVGQKPATANGGGATTPSGWTLQGSLTGANDGDTGGYTTTLGIDTGNCNIFVYTKDTVTGSESGNQTISLSDNNVAWAVMFRVQKSDVGTWSYAAGTGKDTSAGNVSIVTGNMDIAAGDLVIGAFVQPTDVTTPSQFTNEAFSQSGTTFGSGQEQGEPDTNVGNDIGGFICYATVNSGSGSGAVTMSATAGGTTTNVRGPGIVLRLRVTGVTNEVYVATSSNITAGGEATTAQLAAPSGKTTSDFDVGRMWDNENGADTVTTTADNYTELEWCLQAQSPAVNGDYFEFRVYEGNFALGTYTLTPKWTAGTGSVSGSAAITEAADTASASATITSSGSAAVTEAADTASASATVTDPPTGSAAVTEANDTATASAAIVGTGSAAVTEANDTATASGVLSYTGSAAVTEGADTSTASAVIASSGSAAVTEGNDTSTASGTLTSSGSAAVTEANDTASASAAIVATGSAALTEAADTATASAAIVGTGSAAVTEADDTATASGEVSGGPITASAAVTEANDTSTASAVIASSGSAAVTEAADTSTASAQVITSGSAAVSEGADTATASGILAYTGSAAVTEGADTSTASAVVASSGSAALTEGSDSSTASATVASVGSAATTEENDAATASAQVFSGVVGSAALVEEDDLATATGVIPYWGVGAAVEEADTATASGVVLGVVIGDAAVLEEDDYASAVGFVLAVAGARKKRAVPKDILEIYVEQQIREVEQREIQRLTRRHEKRVERVMAARAEPASLIPSVPTVDDTDRLLAAILRRAPDSTLAKAGGPMATAEIDARNDDDLLALLL